MKIKTYKVEFYQDENNNLHCERENDGFNSLEILGMLEETKIQIIKLVNGELKKQYKTRRSAKLFIIKIYNNNADN